jgi:uracil-DNA glycosylase family 4
VSWVEGDGPTNARIAVVGEAPAKEEVKKGKGFVGASGQVLWPMFWRLAGVKREQVWVTNWKKTPMEEEPDLQETALWSEALYEELAELPELKLVVSLGAYSSRALLPAGVGAYWGNGLAFKHPDFGFDVIPVTHPAAGLHDGNMLERTWHGLRGVARYLETREVWPGFKDDGLDMVLDTVQELEAHLENATDKRIGIDTEGTKENPFCLSFSIGRDVSIVVYAYQTALLQALQRWLRRQRPIVVMHNALHDIDVLMAMGINVAGLEIKDTLIHAYVLQDLPKSLKDLARRELQVPMQEYMGLVRPYQEEKEEEWRGLAYAEALEDVTLEQQFTPKGKPRKSKGQDVFKVVGPDVNLKIKKHYERGQKFSLQEEKWAEARVGEKPGAELAFVPPELHVPYAGKDARVTLQLWKKLSDRVMEEGLDDVVNLDHAVQPLIHTMQRTGLHVDIERYHEVMSEISVQRREELEKLKDLVGRDFNPGSGDQVEAALREHEYELTKKTKSGKRYATDKNTLKILREQYGNTTFLDSLLLYRELSKYEDTYLLPMGQMIKGDRLYPNLRTTTVVSGRLSAHAPNVLAWPAKTALGMKLRSIFTAPPGKVLVSWDLSQIELRLAAAFSKDPVMTKAFVDGLDLHTNLASKLFGVPYDQVNKRLQRYPAKTIHYLLLYGGMGAKLYEQLRGAGITSFSLEECNELITSTWDTYSGAGVYLREQARRARQYGYVEDWLGRRRYLPGAWLDPGNFGWALRGPKLEAERQAGNFVIQAGAAEVIKRAMVLAKQLQDDIPSLFFWLQVHDELMGEAAEEDWEEAYRGMVAAMTADSPMTAPIPIETEGVRGASWGELK